MFNAVHKGAKILATVAGAAGILAFATMNAGARDGVTPPVSSKVAVASRDAQVLVKITIDNQSEQTIFVPRALAKPGEPDGNLFDVRDSSNGDPLDYLGRMVKRPPPGKKDYVAIKPHAKLINTVDIGKSYRFVGGRHAYQINFNGSYLGNLEQLEQQTQIEPASAMFAHVGR